MNIFVYMYQDGSSKDDFFWEKIKANNREEADEQFKVLLYEWMKDGLEPEEFEELEPEINKYLNEDEYLLDILEITRKDFEE